MCYTYYALREAVSGHSGVIPIGFLLGFLVYTLYSHKNFYKSVFIYSAIQEFTFFFYRISFTDSHDFLTLPVPIPDAEKKLKAFIKPFWGTTKKCENKNLT